MMRTNRWALLTAGLTIVSLVGNASAQQVQGNVPQLDSGWSLPNGAGPTNWLRLRGDQSVPPRTARHARIEPISVVSGGDTFGRVSTYWTGWEGNGGDRSEYWILGAYKPGPQQLGAKVGDGWSGSNLFRGRLWNEQYFSFQTRRAQLSLYVANAPTPILQASPTPNTNLASFDDDAAPGIQIDRGRGSINLFWETGSTSAFRNLIYGNKRVVGHDAFVDDTLPSPHRDVVFLWGVLEINGVPVQASASTSSATWNAFDSTTTYGLASANNTYTIDLTSYNIGDLVTVKVTAYFKHDAWYRNDYVLGSSGNVVAAILEQQFEVIPEPASLVALGTGLIGLLGLHRRKR
ncbi:hypothetical protein HRbin15_02259 [bacterium HR15]|nr:hypothetical protein HRbin15_02259 [bacterium HR15]